MAHAGSCGWPGQHSAREAASIVKDDYEVLDNHTLVAKTNAFNISFDACGHFISWDPGRLPVAMIDPVEKPDSCAPNGPVDCRHLDFEGDRAPRYEQVSITGSGQVSFTVRSKTFKGVERLRVQTRNNGAVWHVDTVALDTDALGPVPDTVRSLPVTPPGKGMRDVSLVDWLESTLPPGQHGDMAGHTNRLRQAARGRAGKRPPPHAPKSVSTIPMATAAFFILP